MPAFAHGVIEVFGDGSHVRGAISLRHDGIGRIVVCYLCAGLPVNANIRCARYGLHGLYFVVTALKRRSGSQRNIEIWLQRYISFSSEKTVVTAHIALPFHSVIALNILLLFISGKGTA